MFSRFRFDRRVLWALPAFALATAAIRGSAPAQDLATRRQVEVTLTEGTSMAAAASPDRRSIAIDLLGALWLLPFRGGEARRITAELIEARQPTWSPDSRSIAFQGYEDGTWHIYVIPRDGGEAKAITNGLFDDREPVCLTVIDAGHSAGNRQDTGPTWSPDGFRMAFVSEGALWVVPVDERGGATGPPQTIATDRPESPSWEGDSKHIVYQTPRGLRRVIADGSLPERIPLELSWRHGATPERIVVHAGHVVDGVLEAVRGQADIVIESGVIRSIEEHRDDLHTGAVVDATNDYVMPGLIEMHAHLDDGNGENFGRVWLAYGITSVRIPSINPYAGLEQREAFDAGRRPGPRVFLAGDPFDGARVYYPGGVSVTSDEQLERELDRASTLGADFFKTYIRLPDRLQKQIVEFAHAQNKPVRSHELYPAVAFGIDGIEHLSGTSRRGYSPKHSAMGRAYRDVVDPIAKSGVTLTPTIGIIGAFQAREDGDKALLFDERLALFPLRTVAELTGMAAARPDAARDRAIKPYEATLKAIVAGGGTILAGTDAPMVPYGLGLHVELESYVHAGLTPFQALQAATVNAAQALGVASEIGTIEPGKLADLTFLGGDPLNDIRNTRDVKRVMRGGRLFSVADLIKR